MVMAKSEVKVLFNLKCSSPRLDQLSRSHDNIRTYDIPMELETITEEVEDSNEGKVK